MLKKIIALLSIISMLPCVGVMAAYDEASDVKAGTLVSLDILPDTFEENYSEKASVTSGEFLEAVENFMSEDKSRDVVKYGKSASLIDNDATFNAEELISFENALKIAVRAGGYTELAAGYSDISAYMNKASERKLNKGIDLKYTDTLTAGAMVKLLYNLIDAEITDYKYDGTKLEITTNNNETILSRYRKIYELTGIISDNGDTALTAEEGENANAIIAGGVKINKDGNYIVDYLGQNARVFYKEKSQGYYSLRAIVPEDNDIVEFKGSDTAEVDSNFGFIKYEDENEKNQRAKLDPAIKVIYNGQAYFNYSREDFFAEENNIRLIDNNEDGTYDVAFVTSYENIVVSYITSYDGKVVNKYSYDGAVTNIDIDPESDDYKVYFYADEERTAAPEIKPWTVLSVATSKGANPIRNVYVSNEQLNGDLERINDDTYVIDGDEYDLDENFKKALNASGNPIPELLLGGSYTFYFDINGRIAAVSEVSSKGVDYAIMLKLWKDDMDEEIVRIKYMDKYGDWYETTLKNKTKLYDSDCDGDRLKAADLFDRIANAKGKVPTQVVQLSCDSEGKVDTLKLAVSSQKPIKNKLTVGNPVTGCYRWKTKVFGEQNYLGLYLAPTATIFIMPEILTTNPDDYGVNGSIKEDQVYTVTPYNTDEFYTSDCIVMNDKTSGTKADNLFVVSYVSKGVDSEDEVKTVLFGQYGAYSDYSVMAKNNSLFDGIERGDVLRLYTDKRNRVVDITKIYASSSGNVKSLNWNYGGVAVGQVKKTDVETMSILTDCGEYGNVVFKPRPEEKSSVKVYLVEKSKKGVQTISFSDIMTGDYVVMNNEYASLTDVVVIR